MNVFNEIKSQKADRLKEIFFPVRIFNRLTFNDTADIDVAEEEVTNFLKKSLPFKILLATQYFYYKTCGEKNGIHLNKYVDSIPKQKEIAILKRLFVKVRIDEALLKNAEKNLWLITISGITLEGRGIIENLNTENFADGLIKELYLTAFLPFSGEHAGLYEVKSDNKLPYMEGESFDEFIKNDLFRSLDVSSLTLGQCAENHLIQYIVENKSKVYLSINEYPGTGKKFKILYWR